MAKLKNTPVPSDDKKSNLGIKQIGALLSSPFSVPASIINGDLRNAGLGAGPITILGTIGVSVYFGISYIISKYYPKNQIMKYAFLIWLIGIVVALFVRMEQDKQKELDTQNPKGFLTKP